MLFLHFRNEMISKFYEDLVCGADAPRIFRGALFVFRKQKPLNFITMKICCFFFNSFFATFFFLMKNCPPVGDDSLQKGGMEGLLGRPSARADKLLLSAAGRSRTRTTVAPGRSGPHPAGGTRTGFIRSSSGGRRSPATGS